MDRYEWLSVAGFEWLRDEAGYEFVGDRIVGKGGALLAYKPDVANPIAHRDFLALQGEEKEAVLAFVDRHGLLGLKGGDNSQGESLSDVRDAIRNMGVFVAFGHDLPGTSDTERNDAFNRRAPRDLALMAREEYGRTVLRVTPTSFLMWMWIRLAQEKSGDIQVLTCARPGCGKDFYVGAGLMTRRRQYCSEQCRALHNYRIKAGHDAPKPTTKAGRKNRKQGVTHG